MEFVYLSHLINQGMYFDTHDLSMPPHSSRSVTNHKVITFHLVHTYKLICLNIYYQAITYRKQVQFIDVKYMLFCPDPRSHHVHTQVKVTTNKKCKIKLFCCASETMDTFQTVFTLKYMFVHCLGGGGICEDQLLWFYLM